MQNWPTIVLLIFSLGCTSSRWAADDPDYAAKYSTESHEWVRNVKQATDARHLERKGGYYAALSGREDPVALGGEVGKFYYPNPYVEGRAGLAGLIYESDAPVTGGALVGARLQTPTRLAPFVGIGGYFGYTPDSWLTSDRIDNDDDFTIDEWDEAETNFAAALIPEAGCHYWLSPSLRLSGSTSCYMISTGKEDNFWMVNISLAYLSDLGKVTSQRTHAKQARDKGWQIGDGEMPAFRPDPHYEAPSEPFVLQVQDDPNDLDGSLPP